MSQKWIEIARVGRFQDSAGNWQDFSQARLEKIAAGYDPAQREAPLVFGHPTTNGPAYGWVKALKMCGQKLLALPACVSDAVREAVDNGLYRYVSMSLYHDDGLRHIGLLGANPPAIDGLKPVSFADDDGEALIINFTESSLEAESKGCQMTIEELTRQVGELQAKLNAANQERDEAVKKAAALEEELAKLKGASEKTEAEFAAYRDKQETAVLIGRIDQLVKGGKVSPAEKEAVAKTAQALQQAGRAGALNFSDGSENPLETFLKSLESRPASTAFSDFSQSESGAGDAPAARKPISAKL